MNQYTRYMSLKSTIEDLFGLDAWQQLKESNHLPIWKKQLEKVLKALHLSIITTIEIYDDEWLSAINDEIDRGKKCINNADDIEQAIAELAAASVRVSFLQIGFMPKRKGNLEKVTLNKSNWKLNHHRTVMYLQNQEQKESSFWSKQQKEIGFQNQMDIWNKYKLAKSKTSYSKWCAEENQ